MKDYGKIDRELFLRRCAQTKWTVRALHLAAVLAAITAGAYLGAILKSWLL